MGETKKGCPWNLAYPAIGCVLASLVENPRLSESSVALRETILLRELFPTGLSTKGADQNRLDQLARSNSADRRIIAAAINLTDHCFASFDRIVDPHREIGLRGTYDEGLQRDASNLYRDRLCILD